MPDTADLTRPARSDLPVDTDDLRGRVRAVYRRVAEAPNAEFHFAVGRPLAERLGYPAADLDRIPPPALASFAGVGWHLDLAALRPGDRVLDLGSGSGTDSFLAAGRVGPTGRVTGIDMTPAQLTKARTLQRRHEIANVAFEEGYIEALPVADASVDAVISNGVINLAPDKEAVFREAARALRPGGRLAISDIVTERQLAESIVCNASLWAACIGGASQRDRYRAMIEAAGLEIVAVRDNPSYGFLSGSAQGATATYGVVSVSLLAVKR